MARDVVDETPIEDLDVLIGWIAEGCKPEKDFRIGTEHEKFGFRLGTNEPIPYGGPDGIEALLRSMETLLDWEAITDDGRIIGLAAKQGGGAISIEPGGQFELSGAPLKSIHDTCREANVHLTKTRRCAEPLGIGFLGTGSSPVWSFDETPKMPKSRYDIMRGYMPKVGTRGLDMMHRTCTIQVNLDFSTEADMVKKMRVSLALQPVATALFANSPFMDNGLTGRLSERSEIWKDTDNNRAGMLPFAFDEGFGFESYVDYALDVPMYFLKRGDIYHDVTGTTFRNFMGGALKDSVPNGYPMMGDWVNHLGTIFPEVRLKRFLEMRGADGGPWRGICALPAFWVGLLYDQTSLDAAYDLISSWTTEEMQTLRDEVPIHGLGAQFRKQTMLELAKDVVALSREGLFRRQRLSDTGLDETHYLEPIQETLASGMTPAEKMLSKYKGSWAGDLSHIFKDYAF
ncbi:MAG: glutamate--cysteine ligase [Hyphomicrobiales bacterium]